MTKFDCCMRCSGRQTRRPLQLPTWIHILAPQISLLKQRLGDDLSAFVPVPVVPHEAVPEVSKGKVIRNQKKHVPIGIDCDLLNTFHSISQATLF